MQTKILFAIAVMIIAMLTSSVIVMMKKYEKKTVKIATFFVLSIGITTVFQIVIQKDYNVINFIGAYVLISIVLLIIVEFVFVIISAILCVDLEDFLSSQLGIEKCLSAENPKEMQILSSIAENGRIGGDDVFAAELNRKTKCREKLAEFVARRMIKYINKKREAQNMKNRD